MSAQSLVNEFSQADTDLARLRAEKEEIAKGLIPPEIKRALEELDEEYDHNITILAAVVDTLREEAKAAVVAEGASVKAAGWTFKYVKGKSGGWDAKALTELAAAMRLAGNDRVADAILACRKPDGQPYASAERDK